MATITEAACLGGVSCISSRIVIVNRMLSQDQLLSNKQTPHVTYLGRH